MWAEPVRKFYLEADAKVQEALILAIQDFSKKTSITDSLIHDFASSIFRLMNNHEPLANFIDGVKEFKHQLVNHLIPTPELPMEVWTGIFVRVAPTEVLKKMSLSKDLLVACQMELKKRQLEWAGKPLNDEGLEKFPSSLTELTISNYLNEVNISDKGLEKLPSNLVELNLFGINNISNLKFSLRLKKLKTLHLKGWKELGSIEITDLPKSLENLTVAHCAKIDPDRVKKILEPITKSCILMHGFLSLTIHHPQDLAQSLQES